MIDPVCGMSVNAQSAHFIEHSGHRYVFCCNGCREKFRADPGRYIDPAAAAHTIAEAPRGTIYTCPMHPEVRSDVPGSCPICGMALEPLQPSTEVTDNPELRDMTRRFWVGAALAAPLFVWEMTAHVPGLGWHHLVSPYIALGVQFALGTPVVLWAGRPFFERAAASVRPAASALTPKGKCSIPIIKVLGTARAR